MTVGYSMSEEVAQQGSNTPPVAQAVPSAGALLRQAREAAGLHIAALAVSLKVPVKKLEALEADRLHLMHDPVFVRALAAGVCRVLRVDALPVLERLPQGPTPKLQAAAAINEPFKPHGQTRRWSGPGMLTRPITLAVGGLLLAAVVVGFLPELQHAAQWLRAGPGAAPQAAAPQPVPAAQPSAPTPVVQSSAPAATVLEEVAQPRPSAALAAQDAPAVSASGTLSYTAVADGDPLVFRARAATWIEVTDATGGVPLRRTLAPGESVAASGVMPLSVVVGRADAVDVKVRGTSFDLSALAKANVARFEVK